MEPESKHLLDLDQHILSILNDNPEGLEDEILTKKLKHVRIEDKTDAINRLLSLSRTVVNQDEAGQLLYKYVDEEEAQRLRQLEPSETIIYHIIEESGNKGLWINDIKKRAGKLASEANTITRKLDKLGFIKSVKSIKAKNRKVWMVMSVEPSPEVTGGLCAEDVFDIEVMEKLGQL